MGISNLLKWTPSPRKKQMEQNQKQPYVDIRKVNDVPFTDQNHGAWLRKWIKS